MNNQPELQKSTEQSIEAFWERIKSWLEELKAQFFGKELSDLSDEIETAETEKVLAEFLKKYPTVLTRHPKNKAGVRVDLNTYYSEGTLIGRGPTADYRYSDGNFHYMFPPNVRMILSPPLKPRFTKHEFDSFCHHLSAEKEKGEMDRVLANKLRKEFPRKIGYGVFADAGDVLGVTSDKPSKDVAHFRVKNELFIDIGYEGHFPSGDNKKYTESEFREFVEKY